MYYVVNQSVKTYTVGTYEAVSTAYEGKQELFSVQDFVSKRALKGVAILNLKKALKELRQIKGQEIEVQIKSNVDLRRRMFGVNTEVINAREEIEDDTLVYYFREVEEQSEEEETGINVL